MRRDAKLVDVAIFRCFVELGPEPVDLFQLGRLGCDEAGQHPLLALGQQFQRLQPAGAVGVVFHEEDVDAGGKDRFRRQVIGTLGRVGGPEIAPAHVHADRHVGRAVLDRLAQHPGIALDQPVGIHPGGDLVGPVLGVAQIGEEDVVHLQVPAPGLVELCHRLPVGRGDVVEQRLRIFLVFRRVNILGRGAEVAARRAGDRDLGRHAGVRRDEPEMVQHRMIVGKIQLAGDCREDRAQLDAGELHALVAFVQVEAGQHPHEIVVPEGPPCLAVGDGLEADVFLHPDDVRNRRVLDLVQVRGSDGLFLEMLLAGPDDGVGAKKAADVIGAKGWFVSHGYSVWATSPRSVLAAIV